MSLDSVIILHSDLMNWLLKDSLFCLLGGIGKQISKYDDAEEETRTILKEFHQGPDSTSSGSTGPILGLPLPRGLDVLNIVEAHHEFAEPGTPTPSILGEMASYWHD